MVTQYNSILLAWYSGPFMVWLWLTFAALLTAFLPMWSTLAQLNDSKSPNTHLHACFYLWMSFSSSLPPLPELAWACLFLFVFLFIYLKEREREFVEEGQRERERMRQIL